MDNVSLALGIITLIMSAFFPIVAYICGVISLIFAIRNRKVKKTSIAIILCSVGLFIALISNVIGAIIFAGYAQYIYE